MIAPELIDGLPWDRYNDFFTFEDVLKDVKEIKYNKYKKNGEVHLSSEHDEWKNVNQKLELAVPGETIRPTRSGIRTAINYSLPEGVDPIVLYRAAKEFYSGYADFDYPRKNPFVRHRTPEKEKSSLIDHLRESGINVDLCHYKAILTVCNPIETRCLSARPICFNSFDYDRLLVEVHRLGDIFHIDPTRLSPTLARLIGEVEESRKNDCEYPGRHLKFTNIRGVRSDSMRRFSILMLLDEVFYTSDSHLTTENIRCEIAKLHWHRRNDLPDIGEINQLDKYIRILSELVCCTINSEGIIYEEGAFKGNDGCNGHKYKRYDNFRWIDDDNEGETPSAFMMMVTKEEAQAIERDLLGFIRRYAYSGEFTKDFPVLGIFANITAFKMKDQDEDSLLKMSYTDMLLANYTGYRRRNYKEEIREAIRMGKRIKVKMEQNNRIVDYILYPIEVGTCKEDGRNLNRVVLKARCSNTGEVLTCRIKELKYLQVIESGSSDIAE